MIADWWHAGWDAIRVFQENLEEARQAREFWADRSKVRRERCFVHMPIDGGDAKCDLDHPPLTYQEACARLAYRTLWAAREVEFDARGRTRLCQTLELAASLVDDTLTSGGALEVCQRAVERYMDQRYEDDAEYEFTSGRRR